MKHECYVSFDNARSTSSMKTWENIPSTVGETWAKTSSVKLALYLNTKSNQDVASIDVKNVEKAPTTCCKTSPSHFQTAALTNYCKLLELKILNDQDQEKSRRQEDCREELRGNVRFSLFFILFLICVYFILITREKPPWKGPPLKVGEIAIASGAMATVARVPRQIIWP